MKEGGAPKLAAIVEELRDHPAYQPLRYLSRGSFGYVILAEDRHENSGQRVALKFVDRAQVAKDGVVEQEVLNHMRLRHPHVISLNEVFLTSGHLVMVLEFAPGGDLSKRVPAGRGLPEDEARWIFQQLIFALDYCHGLGVATRDIKLENCLVDDSGARPIVKLADFGLSTQSDNHQDGVVGTPMHLAPENVAQLLGQKANGQSDDALAADVWSAGVLLYMLLTGTCPFLRTKDILLHGKQRLWAMFQRIQAVDMKMPTGISLECQDMLASMLTADPRRRPTARELLRHPWFRAAGLDADAMLRCNDCYVQQSLDRPPCAEAVHDILAEASMVPSSPTASEAGAKTGSPNSSDEGSKAWLPRPLRRKKMTSKGPWLAAQRLPSSERPDAG